MLKALRLYILLLAGSVSLWSCTTQDIDPVATLTIENTPNARLSEGNGSATVVVRLNGKSRSEVKVRLAISGTAVLDQDYILSGTTITIPAGELSGSIKVTGKEDNLIEGDETIILMAIGTDQLTALTPNTITLLISDNDIDSDRDGLPDAEDLCPQDSGSVANQGCPEGFGLIINEVLYDPSNVGLAGDANGDGVYVQGQDEFVELFNNTDVSKNIGGYTISDVVISTGLATVRYTFPANTSIAARKALVLFGGGTPAGSFGGSIILTCTTIDGLSLANTGERVVVKDANGNTLLTYDTDALSDNPNESYTRNPDATGNFVQHSTVNATLLFSAGTKVTGASF